MPATHAVPYKHLPVLKKNTGSSSKKPLICYFFKNVSDSGFQVTAFKPCPHMLCRYIHHVINKEHRNPYRIIENPARTIPPGRSQTPN